MDGNCTFGDYELSGVTEKCFGLDAKVFFDDLCNFLNLFAAHILRMAIKRLLWL